MVSPRIPIVSALIVALWGNGAGTRSAAQPVRVGEDPIELGIALRRLNTVGTFMMATAHPDDENNALLALLAKGQGHRVVLLTATRGDGGQNEIGPELFDALAVLRTEELLAAHRLDGAEQYFTRAVDFGYSFSQTETFERWGREEILADFVRMIRTVRPEVVTGLTPNGAGRWTTPPGLGNFGTRGLPGCRRSESVSGAAAGRSPPLAGQEVLFHGRLSVLRWWWPAGAPPG